MDKIQFKRRVANGLVKFNNKKMQFNSLEFSVKFASYSLTVTSLPIAMHTLSIHWIFLQTIECQQQSALTDRYICKLNMVECGDRENGLKSELESVVVAVCETKEKLALIAICLI